MIESTATVQLQIVWRHPEDEEINEIQLSEALITGLKRVSNVKREDTGIVLAMTGLHNTAPLEEMKQFLAAEENNADSNT